MADILTNGLFFTEVLADNPSSGGFDTDGDGTRNKSDEFIEIKNASNGDVSLDGMEIWSATNGLLYSFDGGAVVGSGDAATVVGEYTGTAPDGFYNAGIAEGSNFLPDGEGSNYDTLYLVDTNSGEYIAFSYGDPPQARPLPAGFTGTTQVGSGESFSSDAPNGTSFERDGTGNFVESTPTPGTPPCYARGMLIETPNGPRAVETLEVGDLVNTLDHGLQPIRWIRSCEQPLEDVDVDDKPVLIRADALGKGLPTQDLIVSPHHRIFVGAGGQLEGSFKTESFAPAKSLTAVQGIRHMKGKQTITWIHFACDRHEVVIANGCLSESLLLGPMVVNGLTRMERKALFDIFGQAPTPDVALNGPPARDCLKVGVVRRHIAECLKETQRRTVREIKKWDADLAMEKWEAEQLSLNPSMNQTQNRVCVAAGTSY